MNQTRTSTRCGNCKRRIVVGPHAIPSALLCDPCAGFVGEQASAVRSLRMRQQRKAP